MLPSHERFMRWTLILEIMFVAADGVAALLAGSILVWAELARSAVDVLFTFFSWLSLYLIGRASLHGYNYGLGKLENVASIGLGLAFLISSGFIVLGVTHRFRDLQALELTYVVPALLLAGIGIVVDSWLCWHSHRLARRAHSPIMEATAWSYWQAIVGEAVVLLTLGLSVTFPGPRWILYLDPTFSLLVVGLMVYTAYGIVTSSVRDLLDSTIEESLQILILRCLAHHFHDYDNLHGIRSRRAGSRIFIELFLQFDSSSTMGKVQEAIDAMRRNIEGQIPRSTVSVIPATESPRLADQ